MATEETTIFLTLLKRILIAATCIAEASLPMVILSHSPHLNNDPRVFEEEVARSNFGQNLKPLLAGGAGLWQ